MNAIKRTNKIIIAIHLSFWVLLAVIMVLILRGILGGFNTALTASGVHLIGFSLLIYGHLLYLIPRWFERKKYGTYALGLLLLLFLTTLIRFYIGWGVVSVYIPELDKYFAPSYFISMLFNGLFFVLISIPLKLVNDFFKKQELEKELKTHQLEAELRFLKAQVNPHFLFNALNNIYALSFMESKKTPEMILKLSDMMSYMLYDCKSEKVKLTAEIAYLKNYIDLQQLKKDGEFDIRFTTKGKLSDVMITPMLFIPFFENAFKHGNLSDINNGWLESALSVEDECLEFTIINSLPAQQLKKEKGGVGLANIRERLKLLYPGQHQLNISINEEVFSVHLGINLTYA
jgi:sensor histidine kinase YesM